VPDKTPEEILAEVTNSQIQDLTKTVQRLQKKLTKERDRTEAITNALYEAIHDGLTGVELPDFRPPKRDRRSKGEEVAIAVLSDWQLGKKTETYSSEVCRERIQLYCKKVERLVELQRLDHPVKKLALFLVGDMIEGELIFPGQAWHIDSSLYQQLTIDGTEILGGMVDWASQTFEEVEVHAVPGNHGYLGGRSRREMHPESNADRMLYQIVKQITDKAGLENVTWNIAEDWFTVADLGEGCRFFLLHGEDVRGYAGIPWYGWTRKVMGVGSLERIFPEMAYDHMVAGHFHTPVSIYINGRRLWVNASTESHNPYAARQLSAAGQPAQWLLFAKPGKGITAEYLVDLNTQT
jgi:hypothetical protein